MDYQCCKQLAQLLDTFQRKHFPLDSDDARVSELHADLAMYDTFIVGLLSTVAAHGSVDLKQLVFDKDLERRAEALSQDPDTGVAAEAAAYSRYISRLKDLVAFARRCVDN